MPILKEITPRVKPSPLLALIICLCAFALRVYTLGDANIWFDEGFSVGLAQEDLISLTLATARDVHPPLYFWMLHFWSRIAGETEFALRYLSLAAGTLSVACLYLWGKRTLGSSIGLLGAVLLATSRFHIGWSQEIRMYTLAGLWVVLSCTIFMRFLERPTGKAAIGFVLSTASALYTLYLSALVLPIQNIVFASEWLRTPGGPKAQRLLRWAVLQAMLLVLYLPWLITAWGKLRSGSDAEPFSLLHLFRLYGSLLSVGASTQVESYDGINIGLGLIFLTGLLSAWRTLPRSILSVSSASYTLLWLITLLPPFWIFLVSQAQTLFYAPRLEARFFIPFLAPVYLLLAASLFALARLARPLGVIVMVALVGISAYSTTGHYPQRYLRDELQSMVLAIRAYAQPDDAVVLVSGGRSPIFLYYYERERDQAPPVYLVPQGDPLVTPSNLETQLGPIAQDHPRIWLASVEAHLQDPQGLVVRWLGERYSRSFSLGFAHNRLDLYGSAQPWAVPPENLRPQYPLAQEVGRSMAFLGFDLPTREYRPRDAIHLGIYYRAQTTPARSFSVSLADDRGRILEQRAIEPTAGPGIFRTPFAFEVFSHTPAGLYHFELGQPGATTLRFGELRIAHTQPLPSADGPAHPLRARVGDRIALLGYGLQPARARPGDIILLDLYWQAEQKIAERYTVFTHLLGTALNPASGAPLWGQHDGEPVEGGHPTSQWFGGEMVLDRHAILLDPITPPGEYLIEVGMYRPETGERLPIWIDGQRQEGDRLILASISIQA